MKYSTRYLRVVFRDDGGGVAPPVLRSGHSVHGGSDMRERAERIGARLKVRSRAAAGTEIELTIPGHVAFQGSAARGPSGWFDSLYSRIAGPETTETDKE